MIEVFGDFWKYIEDKKATRACITTNGTVKSNGQLVMGRGIARQAAIRYPQMPRVIADLNKIHGNHVIALFKGLDSKLTFYSFPVKHEWWERADETLITRSAQELADRAKYEPGYIWLLPRPGCGNGELTWESVKPLISFLPDNVHVIDRR